MRTSRKISKVTLIVVLLTVCYSGYIYAQPTPPPTGGGGGGGAAPIGDNLIYLLMAGVAYGSGITTHLKHKFFKKNNPE